MWLQKYSGPSSCLKLCLWTVCMVFRYMFVWVIIFVLSVPALLLLLITFAVELHTSHPYLTLNSLMFVSAYTLFITFMMTHVFVLLTKIIHSEYGENIILFLTMQCQSKGQSTESGMQSDQIAVSTKCYCIWKRNKASMAKGDQRRCGILMFRGLSSWISMVPFFGMLCMWIGMMEHCWCWSKWCG